MNLYEMFEDQQEPTFIDALRDFLPIAVKQLKLTSLPKIKLERNLEDTHVPTFGRFENDDRIISLDIENRHPVDILRTLAHELTHYAQGERGELDDESWRTGSPEENEANAMAGVVMRVFNTEHPQYLKMKPISLPNNHLQEGFMRNAALVTALASVLMSVPAQADQTTDAVGQAIGIARKINRMKGYGPEAAQAEAYQELRNLIRAIGGQGDNYSKIYPHIKGMIEAPGPLPTEVEQLPPLTDEPVNEKWSEKYKSSIDCNNPKGFSQRAHCQGRKKSNEDTCKTHTSPSGVETNMCPDDDDYEINYGKQGAATANESAADSVEIVHEPSGRGHYIEARIDGHEVGRVWFNPTKGGYKATMAWVSQDLRRQGIARKMYQYARDTLGLDIVPSDVQSDDAKAFWATNPVEENFADGKKPGRKGLAKRVGVNCKQPVSKLRSIAKNSSGERQRMAHWCANMKSGRQA